MRKEKKFEGVFLPEPKVLDSVVWDTAIIAVPKTKKVEPVGFFF